MFREPSISDSVQFFVLEGVSAILCSSSHNALYFTLGLNTWAFHFMHYFFTFVMLNMSNLVGLIPMRSVSWREAGPLAAAQLGVTIATGIIHSGGHEGGLYALRLTDFATTILVLLIARHFTDPTTAPVGARKPLVVLIAVFSSLAWAESMLHWSGWATFASPLLVGASAVQRLLVFQTQQRLGCHTDELLLLTCGLSSAALAGPALLFRSDSFTKEMIGTATAWELVDYVLLSIAVVFMCGLTYARFWLMANMAPETYSVMLHAKFTVASVGHWFFHGISQATVFSIVGKVVALGGISVYTYKRMKADGGKKKPSNILLAS